MEVAALREDAVSLPSLPCLERDLLSLFDRYDQGQVCLGALEFSLLPNLPEPQGENRKICLDLAADIIQYVARVLVSPGGGIYSAEDADSGESFEHPERHSGRLAFSIPGEKGADRL